MLKKILFRFWLLIIYWPFAIKIASAGEYAPMGGASAAADASGGYSNGNAVTIAGLNAGVPLMNRLRLQADGAYARIEAGDQYGGTLHLAYQSPEKYLLGLAVMEAGIERHMLTRAGAETKVYLNRFSAAAGAGYQRFLSDDSTYGDFIMNYYPTDNFRAGIEFATVSRFTCAGLSGEYQFNNSSVSMVANAGLVNQGIDGYAFLGIRKAFGMSGQSLLKRDMQNGPANSMRFLSASMGGVLHSQVAEAERPAPAPQDPPIICFAAGTPVLMSDGSSKSIEDVKAGECVKGADGAANTVTELEKHLLGKRLLYSFNKGEHFITSNHAVMTGNGWKAIDAVLAKQELPSLNIGKLSEGDELILHDGKLTLESIAGSARPGDTRVYNLAVSGNETYFAGSNGKFISVHS